MKLEHETLASEMLHELKMTSRRWFIAFIVVLALWFGTIGLFMWYMTLPTDEYSTDVISEDGNVNYIGNDMNGDLYNGEN
jgi:cell division septal protein FtsQ